MSKRSRSPSRHSPTEIVKKAESVVKNNNYTSVLTSKSGMAVLFVALLLVGLHQTGIGTADVKEIAINTLKHPVLFGLLPTNIQLMIKPPTLADKMFTQSNFNTTMLTFIAVLLFGIKDTMEVHHYTQLHHNRNNMQNILGTFKSNTKDLKYGINHIHDELKKGRRYIPRIVVHEA